MADSIVVGRLQLIHATRILQKELVDSKQLDAAKKDDTDRLSVTFRGNTTVVQKREDDSDIYTWGQGINGRLGHGDDSDQLMPKVLEAVLLDGRSKLELLTPSCICVCVRVTDCRVAPG